MKGFEATSTVDSGRQGLLRERVRGGQWGHGADVQPSSVWPTLGVGAVPPISQIERVEAQGGRASRILQLWDTWTWMSLGPVHSPPVLESRFGSTCVTTLRKFVILMSSAWLQICDWILSAIIIISLTCLLILFLTTAIPNFLLTDIHTLLKSKLFFL